MVVALVRSRHRLASAFSILPCLYQASQLQPRQQDVSNIRRLHADKRPGRETVQEGKRMRMCHSTMHTSFKSPEPPKSDENFHIRASSTVSRQTRYISDSRSSDFLLRLVSYNLLAQHQIDKNSYLYDHCKDEVLEWDHRREILLKEMMTFACDIMCLQEVQVDHYEESLKPFFDSLDFESHFKNKTRSGHDGVAIVFRRSRFQLLDVELVEYFRSGNPVLRADNVGIVLLLQPLSASNSDTDSSPVLSPICVANTHLYFNANRGDVKLAQLSLLLASIERMARRDKVGSDHHPVLLCGDFNSEPTSPLFRFLESGCLSNLRSLRKSEVSDQNLSAFWSEPTLQCFSASDLPPPGVGWDCRFREEGEVEDDEEKDELTHPLCLASVYPVPAGDDRAKRQVTSFTAHDVCCVDHIFYTPAELHLISFCDTVRLPEFTRVGGIPNHVHASDHIPLIVDFALRHEGEPDERDLTPNDDRLPHRL